jgi:hypothetical protein
VKEIVRRAELFHVVPVPHPRDWTRVQKIEWLHQNPVRDEVDIRFLRSKVLRLRNVLKRRAQEQQELVAVGGGNGSGGRGHLQGCVPYLSVIMCQTQDSVKCLFLTSANS